MKFYVVLFVAILTPVVIFSGDSLESTGAATVTHAVETTDCVSSADSSLVAQINSGAISLKKAAKRIEDRFPGRASAKFEAARDFLYDLQIKSQPGYDPSLSVFENFCKNKSLRDKYVTTDSRAARAKHTLE